MSLIKKFYNLIKYLFYFFFSKIIFFSINYSKLKKINLLYCDRAGYADFIFFCIEMRLRANKTNKLFCFSIKQYEVAKFFIKKEFIEKSFFLIPKFVHNSQYIYSKFLNKNKNFKPAKLTRSPPNNPELSVPISEWWNGDTETIKFIDKQLEKSDISKNLIKICQKKTLCLFIKNFSNVEKNHLNFQVRQTRDLNKIYKLINHLSSKNLNLVILGLQSDNFIKTLPNDLLKKNKNVYLFKDLTDNNSIADQAYLAKNSLGFIGNMSGPTSLFGILNKDGVILDAVWFYSDSLFKNFLFMYKKIYNKRSKILKNFIWQEYYDPNIFEIVENTYDEIVNNVDKRILSNLK